MNRAWYLDRIRVILTALVILHHTAITYGAPGGWYYADPRHPGPVSGVLLVLFVSVNQAYFMGFFFLLAGYFTPASYDRKGGAMFLRDRLIRLGIPLAVYTLLIHPLTVAVALARSKPFFGEYLYLITHRYWGAGPLWFVLSLLLFSLAYLVWRQWRKPAARQPGSPLPSAKLWFLSAVGVGTGALIIRHWYPVGREWFGLQLGYFSSYIFLFALGVSAWRHEWFDRLTWKSARPWIIVSAAQIPGLVIATALAQKQGVSVNSFSGGLSLQSIEYAYWEPFVAWGIIAAYLLWFRGRGNGPSAAWEFLARRAYAAYIIHPPVLVGVAVALVTWQAPALAKFAVTGSLACLGTFAAASVLVIIPGVRRII
jgi:fucose 4-O-acetylase-like acetyltransferase